MPKIGSIAPRTVLARPLNITNETTPEILKVRRNMADVLATQSSIRLVQVCGIPRFPCKIRISMVAAEVVPYSDMGKTTMTILCFPIVPRVMFLAIKVSIMIDLLTGCVSRTPNIRRGVLANYRHNRWPGSKAPIITSFGLNSFRYLAIGEEFGDDPIGSSKEIIQVIYLRQTYITIFPTPTRRSTLVLHSFTLYNHSTKNIIA